VLAGATLMDGATAPSITRSSTAIVGCGELMQCETAPKA
jgi:hypothetical protein